MTAADYRSLIREVPDFPKPGILFYDITTLLKDPKAFAAIADELTTHYRANVSQRWWESSLGGLSMAGYWRNG